MVFLVVKKLEQTLFLHESKTSEKISHLIPTIVQIQNERSRLGRLISAVEDLILYGPLKPEQEFGYDEDQLESLSKEKEQNFEKILKVDEKGKSYLFNPDPTGRRNGHAPTEEQALILEKTLLNGKSLLSEDLIKANKVLDLLELKDVFENIKGALIIVFPEGLPQWETCLECLENREELAGSAASKDVLNLEEVSLWWASKELLPEKILSDYIGKNEKTKIIVKIQKKGQGAPVKEAPLSEQAQKEMMAYYYKKQEEHKKLIENDDDDYVNSAWANNRSLKSAFSGVSNVKWK
ncbi:hypothetical protein HDU92_002759 [Lobulomyces angularis]|nr:hypothetical protein HDU92_002759 [Lobulomyces angularis]